MNLHDVIPVAKKRTVNLPKAKFEKYEADRENYVSAARLIQNLFGKSKDQDRRLSLRDASRAVVEDYNASVDNLIVETFNATGYKPANVTDNRLGSDSSCSVFETKASRSLLDRFNQSPRASVSDLLEISKIANMIVIPMAYLNPQSYKNENYTVRENILQFSSAAAKMEMQTYVICPLKHYSILEHLKAADPNLPIIANAYQQNFDMLGMMMPAMLMFADRLSSVEGNVSDLYSRMNTLDAGLKNVVRGMESMEVKLNKLQEQVEKQQLEIIKQKVEQEKLAAIQASAIASRRSAEYTWFMPYEPLAFALPKDKTLDDDVEAFIGPCWGPDFDAIIAAALELKMRKGQRAAISATMQSLWY